MALAGLEMSMRLRSGKAQRARTREQSAVYALCREQRVRARSRENTAAMPLSMASTV